MIHRFYNNGYYILLDVHSGAVHVVDKLVYDMLGYLDVEDMRLTQCPEKVLNAMEDQHDKTVLAEVFNELQTLWKRGLLFSTDDYDNIAEKLGVSPVKAMCLHVSHDCNLRCRYCFAGQGDYGGEKQVMTFDVAKAAIDYLIKYSDNRHNLEVDFFGGEPLMNLDIVKQTVDYARSLEQEHNKTFRFTMTTNGMLLDKETSDWLNDEMCNIVLSLDGRRHINDFMRPRAGGQGSYDAIVDKYRYLVKGRQKTTREDRQDYYVRGTFTTKNLDFSEDVLHMEELGFDQVSIEPVVSDPNLPFAVTTEDLPQIFEEYDKLAKIMLEKRKQKQSLNFFHYMLDLDQGPCVIKRLRGCGCGNEYVAVEPGGDVYPCHQFVGKSEWIMGNVFDKTIDVKIKSKFANSNVYNKEPCGECWAKFYCSGGCNANNWEYEGDILKAHKLSCELEKKRLECAIMIKAGLQD